MQIEAFFDTHTSTLTYVVHDPSSHDALIIDPVLDYDPAASKVWTESVDKVVHFIEKHSLKPLFILETHAHADHLSGSQVLKNRYPDAVLAIGRNITKVQKLFRDVFALPATFAVDGSQFDRLLDEDEVVKAGVFDIRVLFTPGHTPACSSYLIGDALFTGDTLFMPDMGTGRCDFPGGSVKDMYESITGKIYTLPPTTRIFVGHDYQPGGRDLACETSVAEQRRDNIQLNDKTSLEDFITFRSERDKTLDTPRLLLQSVQVNIDAGSMPGADDEGRRFLKIPVNVFKPEGAGGLQLDEIS